MTYAFRNGAYQLPSAGQHTIPEVPPACNFNQMKQSLTRLKTAAPKLKQAIVNACASTVLLDNKVTQAEAELLWAIAGVLDVAIPPFLKGGK
ncbi:MAG TPA: hypothetical protein IGS53_13855 [Leptolyngbyaceae cyanobacterium M33_DOE_097]|uniref:Uncharacterized protein n=1 Tax=Oscillatoriales cyanobacterium SpSt-418 TaxID=2282169 RepID=A0A7C3KHH6_9CYAN|nr:hypothetical protein [Leptolyngbyaceae cyanobacterium M33_DOE_097]